MLFPWKKKLNEKQPKLNKNNETLIEELNIIKPEIILLSSESDLFDNPKPRLPIVFEYVETNYSFYNKFLGWTFVKINPNY